MSIFCWATSLVALAGIILNIRKSVICFYLWSVSNASWVVIDLHHEIYAQAALQFIYFLLSLYGIWKWTTSSKNIVTND